MRLPCPTKIPRLTFSNLGGVTGLPIAHGDDGLPDPQLDSPHSAPSTIIPQYGGRLPDPPRTGNLKGGRIVGRLARSVRKIFKAATRKLCGL